MRKRKSIAGLLVLFMIASLACGMTDNLINKAVGDDANLVGAPSLWSDVPPMDGLTLSDMEAMPPFIKLTMRLVLGNLGRLNPEGMDQSTGKIDWIAYTTDKTPVDVEAFYTDALMNPNGWDTNPTPCISGSDQGAPQVGAVCIYQKIVEGQTVQLVIMTSEDEQTKKTNVFYLRLDSEGTPIPPTP